MAVKALAKGEELTLEMNGVVGDGWCENPITAKAISKILNDNKSAKFIDAYVNGPGGYVVEGLHIYQAIKNHGARVRVTVGGQAASCMSLIAMSGDEIVLDETSLFLIHNPWNLTVGDYVEHAKVGSELEMMADVFATAYAARTGMSKEDVRALMLEDRYMNAEEAKKLGFCDRIIPSKSKEKALSVGEARASLMNARTYAMSKLTRTAAAALLVDTHAGAAAQIQPEATEKTTEMTLLALVASALCLGESTTESEVVAEVGKLKASAKAHTELLQTIGAKSTDEVIGVIKGLRDAAEAGAVAIAEANKAKEQARKDKHAALIASASKPASAVADPSNPHAGKLVPAQMAWAESVSLETLEGFLAVAPVIVGSNSAKPPQQRPYGGKAYAEMTPEEKHSLKAENPELFNELRDEALRNGEI